MNDEKKKLIYVSGPSCSGKSTFCEELVKKVSIDKCLLGDDFWTENNQEDFFDRLQATNDDILSNLETTSSTTVLVEWVPSYGGFVEQLSSVCNDLNYQLIHILLYAPKEVLEQRKFERDGNCDLGPVNIEKYPSFEDVYSFDTSVTDIDYIVASITEVLK